jgi:glycosyltransferase involved in cell wall biosynthesis
MACQCPVIATEATGAEDLFTDGVEGFIVPDRDVDALANRLQRVADDPTLQASLAAAALVRVRSLGGWESYGDAWECLLRTLVLPQKANTEDTKVQRATTE